MILIAGGDADPNIRTLLTHLDARADVPHRAVLTGTDTHAALTWDLQADTLHVDGEALRPTAAFLRRDVFAQMKDDNPRLAKRASIWHATIHGWVVSHDVGIINPNAVRPVSKPLQLVLARELGLRPPETVISNDLDAIEARLDVDEHIAKPVPGGGYTKILREVLETTDRRDGSGHAPAIVQECLDTPEIRLYGVGSQHFAFRMDADVLDYRTSDETDVVPIDVDTLPADLVEAFDALRARLGYTYGAADFKTSPDDGALRFLEINSSPMFAGFDAAIHRHNRQDAGTISDALIDELLRCAGTGDLPAPAHAG